MDPHDLKHTRVVLVVDDEILVRVVIGGHLRDVGFTVLEVSNVEDAMSLIASQVRIDLVFSDVNMPGTVDGLGLAQWMQTVCPEIPVILTSAATTLHLSLPNSARFIAKPYALEEVERQIREVLSWPAAGSP